MPFFKSAKSPQDTVKGMKEALTSLERGDLSGKKADKASEEVAKGLVAMKQVLYGTGDSEPQPEMVGQLAQEVYNSDLLLLLVKGLDKLDFESRKDVAQVFNNLLRRQIGTRWTTVEYVAGKADILHGIVQGYDNPVTALNCGMMLRECTRHEPLAKIILHSDKFYSFFALVELPTFDIASDAFQSLRELLTRHKVLVAEYLEQNYDQVFDNYRRLLGSDNYVTKRQSLKLLGELLLDRHNFTTMTKYIGNPENLKLMMNMLRDKSRNIQYEAFHVFKVFVANPNKNKQTLDILLKNKEKLIDFLGRFHNERSEDEQFNDEKAFLIKQIQELQPAE